MKVQNNNRVDIVKIYNDNKPREANDKAKVNKNFDTIQISREGMEIARYVNMSREMSDVRIQKVNEIKNKIQNGVYKVSTEDLAAKIFEALNEEKNNL